MPIANSQSCEWLYFRGSRYQAKGNLHSSGSIFAASDEGATRISTPASTSQSLKIRTTAKLTESVKVTILFI